MRIVKMARIGALAGRLDLDEADESLADGDREIRTRFQVGERRFPDQVDGAGRQAGKFS
ncbi:MAG TPA: hypothetical protein VIH40_09335 [Xanthobacteraceae bacterium]